MQGSQSWSVPICPWKAFSVPVEDGVSSSVPSQMVCPGHSRPVPVSLSHCEVNWGIFSYLKEVLLNSSPSSKLLAVPSFSPLSLSNLRISIIQKSYCLAIALPSFVSLFLTIQPSGTCFIFLRLWIFIYSLKRHLRKAKKENSILISIRKHLTWCTGAG